MGDYRRVSKHDPCPICGKTDWCRVFEDGVECMRVESSVTCSSGGWMHWPEGRWQDKIKTFPITTTVTEQLPPSCLDHVYRTLLRKLTLCQGHYENLQNRGLNPDHYRTLPEDPSERRRVAEAVRDQLPYLWWVNMTPGFYRDRHDTTIAGSPGLLIPIRDTLGYIVGMQIRKDEGEPRYSFLSSRGYPHGTGSGSPVHVASHSYIRELPMIITEGPLKADYLLHGKGYNAIAVPGVNNIRGVIPALRDMGPQRVVVCYDMDWKTNPQVKKARAKLMQMLWCEGYTVSSFSWDKTYKGIDDALRAGCDLIETDYDPDGAVPCSRLFDAA